jgi:hypothetical protein
MSIEVAFRDLGARLRQTKEAFDGLRLTVAEDRPLPGGDVALIDQRADTIDDILGLLDESADAAARGQKAAKSTAKLDALRQSLGRCQEAFMAAAQRFAADLTSYERIAELAGLGRNRGGEWRVWAQSVREALKRCEQPIYDTHQALFTCWRDVTERATTPLVSVQATGVGQRIKMPAQAAPDR